MNRSVSIVMYHYVRDLEHSRFPAIKGLSLDRFRRQLDHIQAHYTPIRVEDLMEAVASPDAKLPPNAILLTFDDGYSDHFQNVFPLLDARGIQGCFFPSALAVRDHVVLDVNKIQFVLAAANDVDELLDETLAILDEFRSQFDLKTGEEYRALPVEEHRYDPREVIVWKRLLQRELPEQVRAEIVQRLFARYVTTDEAAFASELYLSLDQIGCMHRHGMHFGSHGYSHVWFNHVAYAIQAQEVDRSLDFLEETGVSTDRWTMCYPYGGFDSSTLEIVDRRKCALGFSVEPKVADLTIDHRLTLPRIDTNDLPS
jgi:peptidoglycan/xylan/chitin deacetylase (PgdA/CDA1 family)